MQIITHKDFPYKFDVSICSECDGDCCIGESGYIWIDDIEIGRLASYLKISKKSLKKEYLIKVKDRYSIKEENISKDNYRCIFFDLDAKKCSIYEYRPKQCRTFPFWNYFKDNIGEVIKECKAVKF
jgi:Fe-S-cluster containining protein